MGRIRVLQVVRPVQGGIKEHVRLLVQGLDKKKFYPLVACPDFEGLGDMFCRAGAEVLAIPLRDGLHPLADLSTIARLRQIIKSKNIHLIHAHGAKASFLSAVAARLAGIPMIQTSHNIIGSTRPRWQQALYLGTMRYQGKHVDAFIAISNALLEEIKRCRIDQDKYHLIYNGIDLQRFATIMECNQKKKELGLQEGPVIGVVARLIPEKGIDLFLRAAAFIRELVPQAQFLIVGDGPEKNNLMKQAELLKLDPPPVFTGFRNDVPELLPLMQVYAVPSRSEGLSVGILEAMAARRPVIAFAVGGIPEIVTHNVTGILVPPADTRSFALAVIEILTRPTWAGKLGAKARQLVEEKFGTEQMVEKTEKCYQMVIEKS